MKCAWLPALPFVQTWPGVLEQMCCDRLQQTGLGCALKQKICIAIQATEATEVVAL